MPRSKPSVELATAHPLPSPPSTLATAQRASSKRTRAKPAVPSGWAMGSTTTPGWSISTRRYEMPRCRGACGSVRARRKIMSASGASLVQIFVPCDDPILAVAYGGGLERRQIRAGVGLGEALAPDLRPADDRREEPLLLAVVTPVQNGGTDQDLPSGGRLDRRTGLGQFLGQDDRFERGEALASVLDGPGGAAPARSVQHAVPVLAERIPGRSGRASPVEPSCRQDLTEPLTNRRTESLGFLGIAEIHASSPPREHPPRVPSGEFAVL